jgi:hypothetical protein
MPRHVGGRLEVEKLIAAVRTCGPGYWPGELHVLKSGISRQTGPEFRQGTIPCKYRYGFSGNAKNR